MAYCKCCNRCKCQRKLQQQIQRQQGSKSKCHYCKQKITDEPMQVDVDEEDGDVLLLSDDDQDDDMDLLKDNYRNHYVRSHLKQKQQKQLQKTECNNAATSPIIGGGKNWAENVPKMARNCLQPPATVAQPVPTSLAAQQQYIQNNIINTSVPTMTDKLSSNYQSNKISVAGINISPAKQYPEEWIRLLKQDVNNICFSQIVGKPDEPLYTVVGFFPDGLQLTINTGLVSGSSVQTFVRTNSVLITGHKLECYCKPSVAACKELDVSRTVIIPYPLLHAHSQATFLDQSNTYILYVTWDIPATF